MEKLLRYEFIEYSSSNTEALYLRKPLTVAELKRTYPLLKGIVFEFGRSAFEPLRYDHQAYLIEVLQAFDFQEVMIDSVGRLTHLPDTLWKPSLKKLELARHSCNFPVQPPPGFKNNLDAIALRNSDYIDPSIFDTPTLHYAEISAYKGELSGLSKAVNLGKLYLSNTETNGLDFSQFTHLTHLHLHALQQTEYLPDFSALQNLKELRLLYIRQLQVLPKGIETLRNLQSLYCNYLGNAELPKMPFTFSALPDLETLDFANCNFDFSKSQSLKAPALKTLRLFETSATSVPDFMLSPALEKCWLYLSALQTLPNAFRQCVQLKEFTFSGTRMKDFGRNWQDFSNLESISIEVAEIDQLPDFGKANAALQTIEIKAPALNSLPDSWCECPALHTIRIDAKPCDLPDAWTHFPALKDLKIRWIAEEPLFLRKEIALLSDLQHLRIECKSPVRDVKLVQSLNATLTKFGAERAVRLVLGHLILENLEQAGAYSEVFKTDFLQAVNIGSTALKQVIWEHLYLLNPDRGAFSALRQFENKSLFIAGGTRLKKADYKEKLEAMGMKVVSKLSPDVDFILLGNACPDLPEGFWGQPHWFCSEVEMDKVLTTYQPGFMQTLPENDLDALRRLIWSNDPANERVVLEMLKKGGIPDAVVPDLLVVAKTSSDPNVRNDFRKLLKAKVSEEHSAILSNTRDLDKIIDRFRYAYVARPAGVSQIVVAHYYRTKNKALLTEFFRYRQSLENPYRAALFQELYPSFLARPHYLSINELLLTIEELNQILNEPALQGVLKRLLFRCAGEHLPSALFKHTTLNELKIYTDAAHLPEAIGDLKRLKNLEVSGKNLRSLPDSLLQIKSLKYLLFASSLSRDAWEVSEALQTARGGNGWMQQRQFDYLD